MIKRIFIFFIKIVIMLSPAFGLASCSNVFEINAVFRGDSPLYFNVTKLTLTEGDIVPFTVELRKKPASDVTITLEATLANNASQAVLDPPSISFTPANYAEPQTIRVLGVNDCLSDGAQNITIKTSSITSADSNYNNLAPVSFPVTVNDSSNNLPNIVFFQNSDLVTSEIGTVAFFKVNISCAPTADVTVPLVIDKPGEVAIDKPSLVFTPLNYATYQTVAVTGLSDCVLDADQPFTVKTGNVISTDTRFARYTTTGTRSAVYGTNLNYAVNNDTIVSLPAGSLDMTLNFTAGHPDPFISFSVSLTCPITNPVFFGFSFSGATPFATVINTSLGNTYLAFNSTNWSTPQNVLIKLNPAATPASFQAGGYPAAPIFPYTSNTLSVITMKQSDGLPGNFVVPPLYQDKILNANVTVNSW